jgi:hypothetical protein
MIRKRVCESLCETVRKSGEQEVYQAVEGAQGKTLGKTGSATRQTQQVYTQVIGTEGFIPNDQFLPNRRAFAW